MHVDDAIYNRLYIWLLETFIVMHPLSSTTVEKCLCCSLSPCVAALLTAAVSRKEQLCTLQTCITVQYCLHTDIYIYSLHKQSYLYSPYSDLPICLAFHLLFVFSSLYRFCLSCRSPSPSLSSSLSQPTHYVACSL